MTLDIAPPTSSGLGQIITGLDLSRPLTSDVTATLRRVFSDCPVMCVRGSEVSEQRFIALARVFGTPQIQVLRGYRHSSFPEISFISNEQRDTLGDGRRIIFGSHWHTDDSYMAVPCSSTLLCARIVPDTGGDTLFANMYRAYEALPEGLRTRIGGLSAVHKYQSRRNVSAVPHRTAEEAAETPDVEHPLIRTHPDTGRKAIYLNANRIDHVAGLSPQEGDALLDELLTHATRPEFVYRHHWQTGDVVIWDNRCTMHKAVADYGEQRREMLRILLEGTIPN